MVQSLTVSTYVVPTEQPEADGTLAWDRTAGITEWQRVAALAQAAGVELSAHCAPTLHLHVASAVTGLRHVEWFADHARLEALMFDPGPRVRDGVMRPDLGRPGLGVELRATDVDTYRVA